MVILVACVKYTESLTEIIKLISKLKYGNIRHHEIFLLQSNTKRIYIIIGLLKIGQGRKEVEWPTETLSLSSKTYEHRQIRNISIFIHTGFDHPQGSVIRCARV